MRSQGAIPATAHCSYMALPMDLAALLSSATVRERSSAAILSTAGCFDKQFCAVQTTDNAGISLKWFRDTFGNMILQDSINAGISVYEQMNRLCTQTKCQRPLGLRSILTAGM